MIYCSDLELSVVEGAPFVKSTRWKTPKKVELVNPTIKVASAKTLGDLHKQIMLSDALKKGTKTLGIDVLEFLIRDNTNRRIRIDPWEGCDAQHRFFRILFLPPGPTTPVGSVEYMNFYSSRNGATVPFIEWAPGPKQWYPGQLSMSSPVATNHRIPTISL